MPDNKKYIPPVTIRVNDIRAFGREVLVGTHVIDSLHAYFRDNASFVRKSNEEDEAKAKKGKHINSIHFNLANQAHLITECDIKVKMYIESVGIS